MWLLIKLFAICDLLISTPLLWTYVEYFSLFTLAPCLTFFLTRVMGRGVLGLMPVFTWIFVGWDVVAALLVATKVMGVMRALVIFEIALLFAIVYLLANLAVLLRQGNSDARVFAGGFLVAETSTLYRKRLYRPVDAADEESSRPDFAMAIYPGHLAMNNGTLNPKIPVTKDTPPTFLLMAGDDHVDGVEQALAYYTALQAAGVPTEMHLYAQGGHAFGLRPKKLAIDRWPELAEKWMQGLGVLPAAASNERSPE